MSENVENKVETIPTPADFGQFVLEKELGHGGMGSVYLGKDKMLERPVAIKVMLKSMGADADFVERFKREAQAAARLNHPNIAQIYSFAIENGQPYIAMELVPNGSLDKEMAKNQGTLDPYYVMNIGKQLAEGLNLAAQSGLVHGDVKPENVLFDAEGNAKLVDFGLAAMQGDTAEIWGTPYYISPEKLQRQKIDYRADIYSLGAMLYHALTGVAPFEGADVAAVIKARFDGPPKKPSEVRAEIPAQIDAIIMRMLEVDPSMRYPTYESLLGDLNRYLSEARPKKASTGPRVKIKGKRPKMRLSAEGGAETIPDIGSSPIADIATEEVDELGRKKKPMSIGAIIGAAIGGVVLLICLVVGGLIWYVYATKAAEAEESYKYLTSTMAKEVQAISKTVTTITDYRDDFRKISQKPKSEMDEAMKKIRAMLPDDMREAAEKYITQPANAEMDEAIAYTNQLYTAKIAAEMAAANLVAFEAKVAATNAPAATTNAPAATAAATNAPPAATAGATTNAPAATPAPAPAAEQPAEEKKEEAVPAEEAQEAPAEEKKPEVKLPSSIHQIADLWNDVNMCLAADVRVYGELTLLLERTKNVKEIHAKAQNEIDAIYKAGAAKDDIDAAGTKPVKELEKIMVSVPDDFESIKGKKWVEITRRRSSTFTSRLRNVMRLAERQIEAAKARAAKAKKDAEEAAAKKAAEEKAAAELKEKIENETARAQTKFDELVAQRLKYLDWERAEKQIDQLANEFETFEGKEELRIQKKKILCMKSAHNLFKKSRNFEFHNKNKVVKTDDKSITILIPEKMDRRAKKKIPSKTVVVDWKKFFFQKENRYWLNQMISGLLLKGPEVTHSGPMAWSDASIGMALTLKLLLSDAKGADQVIEMLVKKAVKGFEPNTKYVQKWFPEINLENSEEE
ncbi:MAG: serine/threonine protein kinase [Kiritimatiellae bacterium]|nr:serine/threonine protein kinase [Kiritimatiellia bacterium]